MSLDLIDQAPISILSLNHSQISPSAADQTSSNLVDCALTVSNSTYPFPLNILESQSFAAQTECSQDNNISVLIVDDNDINLKVSMHSS